MNQRLEELKQLSEESRDAANTLFAEADYCSGGRNHSSDISSTIQFLRNREASYAAEAREIELEIAEREEWIAKLALLLDLSGPLNYRAVATTIVDAGWRCPG